MMEISLFYTNQRPEDIMYQAATMLDFVSETLAGVAAIDSFQLSGEALEGLSSLCFHLQIICAEGAKRAAA